MKKFLLIFLSTSISTFAQITITSADFSNMFAIGNEITIKQNDGGGSVNIGQLGGDNIWDFSFFQGNLQLDMVSIDPATSPFIDEFPDANFAFYSVGDFEGEQGELWNHSSVNGSFDNFGYGAVISSQPLDTLAVINDPARIEAELPLTINSSWSHSYTQTLYINGVPFISSQINFSAVVDAYGTMILPGGESFEALRMKQTMTINGTASVTYQFLSKDGAQVGVFAADTNPPDTGYISTEGYSWNYDFSGGGNLDFSVTYPGSNDIVISGEMDSIKYEYFQGNVDLYYSLDDGMNYVLIDSNYNTLFGIYYWDVPDSLLTAKARIKVVDSSPDSAVSALFKIKPWQLSRLDGNDELELYQPDQDGWPFSNSRVNMWWQTWWQQFDYQGGTDPYTNSSYPPSPPFLFATDSLYPDWPMFVDVFGVQACYREIPVVGRTYRPSVLIIWGIKTGPWGGSCFGFAVSSLLGFYHKDYLIQLIGNFNDLNSVSLSDESRYVPNSFQIYQWDKEYRDERRNDRNKTPRDLLTELKEMLREENGDGRVLAYWDNNGSGGHAVVPYKLERATGLSKFNVRVYNPNRPDSTNQFIYIDSVANTWSDSTSLGFGTGSTGCRLERKSESFLYRPNFRPAQKNNNNSGSSRLTVYNTPDAEITITSSTGQEIGYQDSIAFNNMTDAVPIIPLTGYFQPPIGYDLPEDDYTLHLNNFTTERSNILFQTDSTIYNYRRYNAEPDESDLLNYSGTGIKITNPDLVAKQIQLETIIINDTTSEKAFLISNMTFPEEDSIIIKEKNRNDLLFNNFGDGLSYDLYLRYVSLNTYYVFEHNDISISQNSGHQLVPDWNNLQNTELKILIDLGNDGTFDDTIFVKNQATNIEDEGSLLSPDTYNLAQNFPNPFNPATSIRYSIPKRSNVILKVYDILGNEVASLVNEEKDRGVYTVTFNATGLASGIYFYTIRADGFVQTKKMLLVK